MPKRVFQGRTHDMTHNSGVYGNAIKNTVNPPRKKFGRRAPNHPQRHPVLEFSHQVRKNTFEAARHDQTFPTAAILLDRFDGVIVLGESLPEELDQAKPIKPKTAEEIIFESIKYLSENQPHLTAINPRLGEVISAIANHDLPREAYGIIKALAREESASLAANVSLGTGLTALIKHGFERSVGSLFFKLAVASSDSVQALASNPSSGWIISELAHVEPDLALNCFIVIATHEPELFAANGKVDKALHALSDCCAKGKFDEGFVEQFHIHQKNLLGHNPALSHGHER